jgi:hypothetical protein
MDLLTDRNKSLWHHGKLNSAILLRCGCGGQARTPQLTQDLQQDFDQDFDSALSEA